MYAYLGIHASDTSIAMCLATYQSSSAATPYIFDIADLSDLLRDLECQFEDVFNMDVKASPHGWVYGDLKMVFKGSKQAGFITVMSA